MSKTPYQGLVNLSAAAGAIEVDGTLGDLFIVDLCNAIQTLKVKNVRPGQTVRLYWQQAVGGAGRLSIDGASTQAVQFPGNATDCAPSTTASQWSYYTITGRDDTKCFMQRNPLLTAS